MNNEIKKAISDSQVVLAYACENGLVPEGELSTVDIIVRSKTETDNLSPEQQTEFWMAYSKLTKLINGVSVESLVAVEGHAQTDSKFPWFTSKLSDARKSVRFYQRLGFLCMIVMLTFQIYWIIGAGFISDIKAIPEQRSKLVFDKVARQEILGEKAPFDIQILFAEGKISDLEDELESSTVGLTKWFSVWTKFASAFNFGVKPANETEESAESSSGKITRYASFVLETIQSYVLPILYGLLGAVAFILRKLSKEISEKKFSRESRINYILRVHLGALAGLAIGWFFGGSAGNAPVSISSLSPLALAFLGGYSVDVVFNGMDRLIESISLGKENGQKTSLSQAE